MVPPLFFLCKKKKTFLPIKKRITVTTPADPFVQRLATNGPE